MRRRLLAIVAILSAVAFAVTLAGLVHGRSFYREDVRMDRWHPATRTFTTATVSLRSCGIYAHAESTTATPQDNTSALAAMTGVSYTAYPASRYEMPLLWGDHYRSTPSIGINTNGLSDCWTLTFRYEIPLAVFAILPTVAALRWWRRRRVASRQGFAVVPGPSPS